MLDTKAILEVNIWMLLEDKLANQINSLARAAQTVSMCAELN